MIGLCDDIGAGRDQPKDKRRTEATKPEYQPTRHLLPWAYRRPVMARSGKRDSGDERTSGDHVAKGTLAVSFEVESLQPWTDPFTTMCAVVAMPRRLEVRYDQKWDACERVIRSDRIAHYGESAQEGVRR